MIKLAIVCAAAGMLLATPAVVSTASAETTAGVQLAQADVSVRIGRNSNRHSNRHRRWNAHRKHCTTKVIYRNHRKTVIKTCR